MEEKNWLMERSPFLAKNWGVILELAVLAIGFLVILITTN